MTGARMSGIGWKTFAIAGRIAGIDCTTAAAGIDSKTSGTGGKTFATAARTFGTDVRIAATGVGRPAEGGPFGVRPVLVHFTL